ncbi:MAG: hypothetical protein ACI9A0_003228 [Pseudoalteromonas tetraodonis]|jgi:hypothetical protein
MKYILVSDATSASVVRRNLASTGYVDIKVGTFTSLIELLTELWLLPEIEDNFEQVLSDKVFETPDAFWSESLKVDQAESLASVESCLLKILSGLPLSCPLQLISNDSSRATRYYNNLVKLFERMGQVRPYNQMVAQVWLTQSDLPSIESVELICAPGISALEPWKTEVVDKLLSLATTSKESAAINSLLAEIYQPNPNMNGDVSLLNQHLFNVSDTQTSYAPNSIHWLTCRDSLQESEVAVGMLKQTIDSGVAPSEVAVIVPKNSEILSTLPSLMNYAGMLTSNKHALTTVYQWELQLVKDCLIYFQERQESGDAYAPMSLAAVLTNPLMPWSKFTGQKYADFCFNGAFTKPLSDLNASEEDSQVLTIVCNTSDVLWDTWLESIIEQVHFPKDSRFASKTKCLEVIDELKQQQVRNHEVDLHEQLSLLINQIQPKQLPFESGNSGALLNGVLILDETEVLLAPVKHLFILGFNQGCYDVSPNVKGIFTKSNWQDLSDLTGFNFERTAEQQNNLQEVFKSNLSRASDSITLLLSELNFDGSKSLPSSTLLDMALCFQPIDKVKPELLLTSINDQNIKLPFFTPESVSSDVLDTSGPTENKLDTLELAQDLIALNKDKDGNQRSESPSSLSDMLVSPFAWFLNRQGLTSKGWEVQDLSIMLQGTIAHKVFELHFDSQSHFSIDSFEELFHESIVIEAPFLLNSSWRIERIQLQNEVYKSIVPFVEWCQSQHWKIKETELSMLGHLWDIPLRGFADAIFENAQTALIIDYKKSKSDKRLKMLNAGFDLQTYIYRELYQQMTKTNVINVRSGYYTMNDNVLLVDGVAKDNSTEIQQVSPEVSLEEQSENAIKEVMKRLSELRNGIIELNSIDEQKRWNDVGIAAEYTFDRHPLVKHFMKPAEEK